MQNVVSALNNEKTRLVEMEPIDAIKETLAKQGFSQLVKKYKEKLIDVGMKVRYLYEPGELEGQEYRGERRRRSTDPIWSVDVCKVKDRYIKEYQPTLYYLDSGPKRSFVFVEIQPIQDPWLFDPISCLVLSTLIHSWDWISVDSNLPYLTPVISSGERNYMKESFLIA